MRIERLLNAFLICGVLALGLLPRRAAAQVMQEQGSLASAEQARDLKRRANALINPFWVPHMPRFAVGLYLSGGGLAIKAPVRDREAIGSPAGGQFGLSLTLWRYLFQDTGFGVVKATDRRPFSETACSSASGGDCSTDQSSITGVTGWFKLGPQLRLFVATGHRDALELALRGGFGVRGLSLSRSAGHAGMCLDCREDHVAAGAGFMLSPEAETAYAFGSQADSGAVGVKVTYEDYLTGDVTHGLWISGFFEGFVW
ncbi:MAG TPA: hypothetical protein VGF76_19670 [Polyangiaceae bacterium]